MKRDHSIKMWKKIDPRNNLYSKGPFFRKVRNYGDFTIIIINFGVLTFASLAT